MSSITDATKVHISSNAPYFDIFTCEDNGDGMTVDEFEKILNRIGSSYKQIDKIKTKKGRLLIGKIGIGLLAIAQICHKFTVISKTKISNKYFQATIDLKQFSKIEIPKQDDKKNKRINLGICEVEDDLIDTRRPNDSYTKIIMEDIKIGFAKKLKQSDIKQKFKLKELNKKSKSMEEFVHDASKVKFNDLCQYDQLIWELSLISPIKYLDKGPFKDKNIIINHINRLEKNNFNVYVDGIEIKKPILLPTEKKLTDKKFDWKIYPIPEKNVTIDDNKLKFSGYLYHQRKRILPDELRGIIVRIKDVAIGNYDRAFLHYPKAEGPMITQITGEIFVEEGLEEALNIDRNSFNETHSHYLKIQEVIWNILGDEDGVFRDIRNRSKERNELLHKNEAEKELNSFIDHLNKEFNMEINLKYHNKKKNTPYEFHENTNSIIFYSNKYWHKNRVYRKVQEKIIIASVFSKLNSTTINDFQKYIVSIFSKK